MRRLEPSLFPAVQNAVRQIKSSVISFISMKAGMPPQARLKWRPRQALMLLELRVRCLEPPLALAVRESFWGCFFWVDVGPAAAAEAAQRWQHSAPALSDGEFAAKQAALRRALAGMEADPLPVV